MAITVVNGIGPWLSPIVALAANSPFWNGRDAGCDSYRTELWRRWPMAGTPAPFVDRDDYVGRNGRPGGGARLHRGGDGPGGVVGRGA